MIYEHDEGQNERSKALIDIVGEWARRIGELERNSFGGVVGRVVRRIVALVWGVLWRVVVILGGCYLTLWLITLARYWLGL